MTKFTTINNEAYVNIDFIDHNVINAYAERTAEGTFLLLSDVIKNMTTFDLKHIGLFYFNNHDGLESFTITLYSKKRVYFDDICSLRNIFVERPQIIISALFNYDGNYEIATKLHFDLI